MSDEINPVGPLDKLAVGPQAPLTTEWLQQLAVRQIMADIDRITIGRRRIDIAHALLTIIGQEIAAKAATPAAARHHGQIVARQLKAFVRDAYDERQRLQEAP